MTTSDTLDELTPLAAPLAPSVAVRRAVIPHATYRLQFNRDITFARRSGGRSVITVVPRLSARLLGNVTNLPVVL